MGLWKWEGFDKRGKKVAGRVQAPNRQSVRKHLRGIGVRPKTITPPSILEFDLGEWMVENGMGKSVSSKELTYFTRQLAIMMNAGVPILQSLEVLAMNQTNLVFKRTLKSIHTSVEEGMTLADAMGSSNIFNKLYSSLVRAGEASGVLGEILDKLAIHREKQEKTVRQIKGAMTYPLMVTIIGGVVIYFLMVFVVPMFVDILKESGQEVPLVTQIVIGFSDWLQEFTIYLIPGIILISLFLQSYVKTPTGKRVFSVATMRMPIFGPVVIKGNLSHFARTLATMMTSGVSLPAALDICIETVDNVIIRNDIKKVKKAIIEGKTLTGPISKIPYFPPMVVSMLQIGEQTGKLDHMLEKISLVFEDEVEELIANMTKLVEPLIIVVLGGAVAFVLVAMYLPIFMSSGGA